MFALLLAHLCFVCLSYCRKHKAFVILMLFKILPLTHMHSRGTRLSKTKLQNAKSKWKRGKKISKSQISKAKYQLKAAQKLLTLVGQQQWYKCKGVEAFIVPGLLSGDWPAPPTKSGKDVDKARRRGEVCYGFQVMRVAQNFNLANIRKLKGGTQEQSLL